jgi:hypothetical protein
MSLSLDEVAGILGDAFREVRSPEGQRLGVAVAPDAGGEQLTFTVILYAEGDVISELREWNLAPPDGARASAARLRAFAEGSRGAGTLDWETLYPDDFPCWPLLAIPSLRSADDFARVLADPVLLRDTMATQWAAGFGAARGLPALPIEASRELYPLSRGTTSTPSLEANLRALSAATGPVVPWLLALLEQWADEIEAEGGDGWIAPDNGSLRTRLATLAAPWLTPRADPGQSARLDRLRERDLIEYGDIPLSAIEVGRISLPTGRVIAADPFFSAGSPAIAAPIAPGTYPVRIALGTLPDWGQRVLAARLDVLPGAAVSWRRSGSGFAVDAGLACFMSLEACEAFEQVIADFREQHPDGNYYTEVLGKVLGHGCPPGKWALHRFGEGHEMAVFASGLGDGGYEVLAGEDAAGRVVSLLIDFGMIEGP